MRKDFLGHHHARTSAPSVHPGRKHVFEIFDSEGRPYKIKYFRYPKHLPSTLKDKCIVEAMPSILKAAKAAFPNYSSQELEKLIRRKTQSAEALTLIYPYESEKKEVIGFRIDNFQTISLEGFPIKIMYLNQVGIHPSYQGKRLMKSALSYVYALEAPDILCASSANPKLHMAARSVAHMNALEIYPRLNGESTPSEVYVLANTVHNKLTVKNMKGSRVKILLDAKLDRRLVRTYQNPTTRGEGKDLILHDVLGLGNTQHAFFMALSPEVNKYVRNLWRKK